MWVCELQREMELREERYFDRMNSIERTLETAIKTAKLAVDKAETAANERFEAANNVKAEMGAQLSSLMPRQEITTRIESIEKSIDDLTHVVSTMAGRGVGVDGQQPGVVHRGVRRGRRVRQQIWRRRRRRRAHLYHCKRHG